MTGWCFVCKEGFDGLDGWEAHQHPGIVVPLGVPGRPAGGRRGTFSAYCHGCRHRQNRRAS